MPRLVNLKIRNSSLEICYAVNNRPLCRIGSGAALTIDGFVKVP